MANRHLDELIHILESVSPHTPFSKLKSACVSKYGEAIYPSIPFTFTDAHSAFLL